MGKILISYYSRTGKTKKMAEYIAEGVRFGGNSADVKPLAEIKSEQDLEGYDGYAFGCPTYHRDMTANMKQFLFLVEKANLSGKAGGAFGSYTYCGTASKYIYDTMEHVFKMKMTSLGPFDLLEHLTENTEGMKACQDYGKGLSDQLNS